MAYTKKDFEAKFKDFSELERHELLVATESNGPFPLHANNELEAKYKIEDAIQRNAWDKLPKAAPTFKDVLPPMPQESAVSTVGLLRNSLFSPKPAQKAPAPNEAHDNKTTFRKS